MNETQATIARRANDVRQHGGIIITRAGLDVEIHHTPASNFGPCRIDCAPQVARFLDIDTGNWPSIERAVAHVMGVRWEG